MSSEPPATKPKMGRPSKYQPSFVDQVRKLCEIGATDYEIAKFFEVNVLTIHRWKVEYEDFCNALIAGKDKADERVVRSLFNRAVGYTFESEKVFQHQGKVVRAKTDEHVPPESGAAKLWLVNRRPKEWRDRHEHVLQGPNGPIETITREMTPKEAADAYARTIDGDQE